MRMKSLLTKNGYILSSWSIFCTTFVPLLDSFVGFLREQQAVKFVPFDVFFNSIPRHLQQAGPQDKLRNATTHLGHVLLLHNQVHYRT
jgi:hypothetical protein